MVEDPDGLPRIPSPARRALFAAGYATLDELAGASRRQLATLHGMGPKALGLLQAALEARGQSLAE